MSLGPLQRVIFPYLFHFRGINTHIFVQTPLTGDSTTDQRMILDALRQGHAFVGYDLPGSTRGSGLRRMSKTNFLTWEMKCQPGLESPSKSGCPLNLNAG